MDSKVSFVVLLFAISAGEVFGQLSSTFYDSTCSNLTSIVRNVVQSAVNQEARTAASLLRLHFHDCFVQGCDASILLDDTDTFTGEKNAGPNKGSLRKYDVIDDIKAAVESSCPGVVSCADILAIAALESVALMGGPSYTVQLGRRDSTTASFSSANSDLPRPTFNVSELVSNFGAKGLSTTQMVALSGAHTLGQAQCIAFRSRIYSNDSTIDQTYATNLQSNCPSTSGDGDSNLADLDVQSPNVFDSKYYENLLSNEGLLTSDQVLYSTSGTTRDLVNSYATSQSTFFQDFGSAMIAMGNIDPLTGSNGEIRTNCRRVNS